MLKNTQSPQYEFEMISLEQLIPKDRFVRKINKAIEFEFIRDEVAHFYCQDNGRPAVDSVRLLITKFIRIFRTMLITWVRVWVSAAV